MDNFTHYGDALLNFIDLDDNDIWTSLKVWAEHEDKVLSSLSTGMINRKLFKIEISDQQFPVEKYDNKLKQYCSEFHLNTHEASYFISSDKLVTNMYTEQDDSIDIIYKNGIVKDISQASDMLNIELLKKKVIKYYFAYLNL
jgi:hypothetical protein